MRIWGQRVRVRGVTHEFTPVRDLQAIVYISGDFTTAGRADGLNLPKWAVDREYIADESSVYRRSQMEVPK